MAQRRDPVVDEIREIRRRISKRLLEAERREGTCVPELRRMARKAAKEARRELNGHRTNGHKHTSR